VRFFHLSDLHIGKQLHYYNLKQNQTEVLNQIVTKAKEYRPNAVLICGDIFDKSVPSGEAYTIFDEFLNKLAAITPHIPILIIAGNHDHPQRLSYGSTFMEKYNIYIAAEPPQVEGEQLKQLVLEDDWGQVHFYLLPFLKPGHIRHLFAEGEITDYESAVRKILEQENLDFSQRNVLLSHQFYTSKKIELKLCDSESAIIQMGGLDQIDVSVIQEFDYAALGHLHGTQKVLFPHIRYCGTPLKYSISEEFHHKSITLVTLREKGAPPQIETIPLLPLQEVRSERGLLNEVLKKATPMNCHDFVSVTITDEQEPFHPKEQLEEVYDYLLELKIDNTRTRDHLTDGVADKFDLDPFKIFSCFFEEMNSRPLSQEEGEIMNNIMDQIGERSNEA
jgi:exonuclease SbcD